MSPGGWAGESTVVAGEGDEGNAVWGDPCSGARILGEEDGGHDGDEAAVEANSFCS